MFQDSSEIFSNPQQSTEDVEAHFYYFHEAVGGFLLNCWDSLLCFDPSNGSLKNRRRETKASPFFCLISMS